MVSFSSRFSVDFVRSAVALLLLYRQRWFDPFCDLKLLLTYSLLYLVFLAAAVAIKGSRGKSAAGGIEEW
jgi:hypothetical protein